MNTDKQINQIIVLGREVLDVQQIVKEISRCLDVLNFLAVSVESPGN